MMRESEIMVNACRNNVSLTTPVESVFRNRLFVIILPAREVVISVSVHVPADAVIQRVLPTNYDNLTC